MPAPKGMRNVHFTLNSTDAVHVYSEPGRLWLQLRRDIPTINDIGKPSFKTALSLTPSQAIALAGELLTAATLNGKSTETQNSSPGKSNGSAKSKGQKPSPKPAASSNQVSGKT